MVLLLQTTTWHICRFTGTRRCLFTGFIVTCLAAFVFFLTVSSNSKLFNFRFMFTPSRTYSFKSYLVKTSRYAQSHPGIVFVVSLKDSESAIDAILQAYLNIDRLESITKCSLTYIFNTVNVDNKLPPTMLNKTCDAVIVESTLASLPNLELAPRCFIPSSNLSSKINNLIYSIDDANSTTISKVLTVPVIELLMSLGGENVGAIATLSLQNRLDSHLTGKNRGILLERSVPMLAGRDPQKIKPFSVKLFGAGNREAFENICLEMQHCIAQYKGYSQDLQGHYMEKCLNNYFKHGKQPSYIITPSLLYDNEFPKFNYKHAVVIGSNKTHVDDLWNYYKSYISLRQQLLFSEQRRAVANAVSERLTEKYFQQIGTLITDHRSTYELKNTTKILVKQFLSYTCEDWILCGGLGDRLKGSASLFYMAIASNRVFNMDWEKPEHLNKFFRINKHWYNLTSAIYSWQRSKSRFTRHWCWPMDGLGEKLVNELSNDTYVLDHYSQYDSLDITANRYKIMMPIFASQVFSKEITLIFPELTTANFNKTYNIDYGPVISAAYKAMLSKPQPAFDEQLTQIIAKKVGFDTWNSKASPTIKIGVQIRTCRSNWGEGGNRVAFPQIACFAEKVQQLVGMMRRSNKTKVIVFVTSDYDRATEVMRNYLANVTNLDVFGEIYATISGDKSTTKHLDRPELFSKDNLWSEVSAIYTDWYLLTKMDLLLISRSGYGETAALFSLRPSWQLIHWLTEENNPCPFIDFNKPMINLEF